MLERIDMKRTLAASLVAVVISGSVAAAHHSYGAYDRKRVVEIDGTLESFEIINPHSLLKIRSGDAVYAFEWAATRGIERLGIGHGTFKAGDRLIVGGSPRRDFEETLLLTIQSVHRPADGWRWSRGQFPTVGTMGGPGGPGAPSGSNR